MDKKTFLEKWNKLTPEDREKVITVIETGKIPEGDREDFEKWRIERKVCLFCGKELPPQPKRSRRRYCDNSHKQADYRRRKIERAGHEHK